MNHHLLLLCLLGAACATPAARPETTPAPRAPSDAQAIAAQKLGDTPACLVVTDASGTPLLRAGEERCAERLRPYSTFKIPNTLIGLESGALADEHATMPWRGEYPREDWWPDVWTAKEHTLQSAFHSSHVPFYRTLAKRVGHAPMAKWIGAFEYGNQNFSEPIDSFWLNGELAISADEQVAFLRRFYEGKLGLSPHTYDVARKVFVRRSASGATLSAKTGTGGLEVGAQSWFVGYVESKGTVHYFALNIDPRDGAAVPPAWREETVLSVLHHLGVWPEPAQALD